MVQDCILFNSLLVLWLHSFQLYTATKHLCNGTGYIPIVFATTFVSRYANCRRNYVVTF